MSYKDCHNCKHRDGNAGTQTCVTCGVKGNHPPSSWEAGVNYVPMTNADRIRAMSDEELAIFICCSNCIYDLCDVICGAECKAIATLDKSPQEACKKIVSDWLRQPAEEEANHAGKTL